MDRPFVWLKLWFAVRYVSVRISQGGRLLTANAVECHVLCIHLRGALWVGTNVHVYNSFSFSVITTGLLRLFVS